MVTTVRSTGPEHPLRISVLGPVRAWAGTEELKLGAPQRKAVLAVLAMRVGEVVTKSELIDAVWGETPPTGANGSLYTYISSLRGALEPGRSTRSPGRVLESDSVGYRLSLRGEFAVDAIQFDALCARVKRCLIDGATADALDALDAALALWHGDALTGIPGPFADAQRGRLTDLRLTMVERRARLLINAGRHHEVVHDLDRWSNDHPSREGLLSLLMHAQHIAGRSAAALEAFDRFCASSGARLGAEPGPALTELAERIRLDDPRLGMTVDDPAGLTRPIPLVAWSRPRRSRHFVGRGAELSAIRAAVTAVS